VAPERQADVRAGLRYDFYSVVKDARRAGQAILRRGQRLLERLGQLLRRRQETTSRAPFGCLQDRPEDGRAAGFGLFYGPGQFEDRIQPIENAIERRRVGAADIPNNGLAYPVSPATLRNTLSIRGYTHRRPDEYKHCSTARASRASCQAMINLNVGYTGSRGKDMFLRGVGNILLPATRTRPAPSVGQVDYKTSGCLDGLVINRLSHQRMRARQLRCAAGRQSRRFRAGFTGGLQYQYSHNKGTTQGSNEAATTQKHVRLQHGIRHQPAGHPAHLQRVAGLSSSGEASGPAAGAVGGSSMPAAACPSTSPSIVPDNITVARRDQW
jgi:hypothetical protein